LPYTGPNFRPCARSLALLTVAGTWRGTAECLHQMSASRAPRGRGRRERGGEGAGCPAARAFLREW
jgi:hypothetical protein